MRNLTRPTYSARSALELCANSIRNDDLAGRLQSVATIIDQVENTYLEQAELASLYTIQNENNVGNVVTGDEMKTLYKGTFSRKGSRARPIYDAIKMAPAHGICPLCGQRTVSTLDHYLPQSLHPSLTVTPINLVPACADCNKAKLDRQPTTPEGQTLHPYFDGVSDIAWLKAHVTEQAPPALVFSAAPPASCPSVMQQRLRSHFETFGLGTLYAAHAAVELANNKLILMQLADRVDINGVRSHLLEQADSRRAIDRNSWQCAMYDALAVSDWFCREGYQAIQ